MSNLLIPFALAICMASCVTERDNPIADPAADGRDSAGRLVDHSSDPWASATDREREKAFETITLTCLRALEADGWSRLGLDDTQRERVKEILARPSSSLPPVAGISGTAPATDANTGAHATKDSSGDARTGSALSTIPGTEGTPSSTADARPDLALELSAILTKQQMTSLIRSCKDRHAGK